MHMEREQKLEWEENNLETRLLKLKLIPSIIYLLQVKSWPEIEIV